MSRYALTDSDDTNFEVDEFPISAIALRDEFDLGIDAGCILTVVQIGEDFVDHTIRFVCEGGDGCTYERAFSTDCFVVDIDADYAQFYGFEQQIMEY